MKTIAMLMALILMTGCANMTPREKQTAAIVGAIVVAAIVISADGGDSKQQELDCYWAIRGDGQGGTDSTQVCR